MRACWRRRIRAASHCTPIVTAAAPIVAAEPTRNLRLVIACARIERPIVRLLPNPCPIAVRALRLTERGVAAYRLRDEVSNVWLTRGLDYRRGRLSRSSPHDDVEDCDAFSMPPTI